MYIYLYIIVTVNNETIVESIVLLKKGRETERKENS